jgi:CheY-like chemotaxis protein
LAMHQSQPGEVVLVVEDAPAFPGMLVDSLGASGSTILEAADAGVGLGLVTQHVPDPILLDLALPQRTGEDVLPALKEDARTRHIPVPRHYRGA